MIFLKSYPETCPYLLKYCLGEDQEAEMKDCDRVLVASVNADYKDKSLAIARALGERTCVECIDSANLKRQLRYAAKNDLLDVVIVGDDIRCRYMRTGTEVPAGDSVFDAICRAERVGERL